MHLTCSLHWEFLLLLLLLLKFISEFDFCQLWYGKLIKIRFKFIIKSETYGCVSLSFSLCFVHIIWWWPLFRMKLRDFNFPSYIFWKRCCFLVCFKFFWLFCLSSWARIKYQQGLFCVSKASLPSELSFSVARIIWLLVPVDITAEMFSYAEFLPSATKSS